MFIQSVLSHLGGWSKLEATKPTEFQELITTIDRLDLSESSTQRKLHSGHLSFSPVALHKQFMEVTKGHGWETKRLTFGKTNYSEIDVIKDKVGIEFAFGKFAFVESDLFVKFPIFVRARQIDIGVVLIPTKSLANKLNSGIGYYEMIETRMLEAAPGNLRYPFALIGISDQPTKHTVTEMTSSADRFLIDSIGLTLFEVQVAGEARNYDFKERLPENRKVAQEVCAFANLRGGGLIILGVNDKSKAVGYVKNETDSAQLKILDIVKSKCNPVPQLDFHTFEFPDDPSLCYFMVKVHEIRPKPCVVDNIVYIRSGAQARPAEANEIRSIVLGDE